mgnify:CR=1 FL=1
MDTIYRIASNVARVVSHRGFAASVLAVGSAGVVAFASVTANAVAGAPADKVVLSMQNNPYVVQADMPVQTRQTQADFDVTVKADGAYTLLRVSSGTVGSALETVGITVGEDDIVSASLDDELVPDMEITVQRVTYRDYTETQSIPYETETTYDDTLAKGTSKVEVKGQKGERELTYRERLVDGEVVESNLLKTEIVKEPVNQQKVEGTYVAPATTTKQTSATKGEANPGASYSEDDLYCLAVAIYREAGSDYLTDEHRALVGCVVMNRVRSPRFPNTVRGVLTQPGQYAGLWQNGVYFPAGTDTSSNAVQRAYRVAREVLEGQWSCPSNVVFQANFQQGSGVYRAIEGGGTVTYFCYQ